MSTAKSGRKIEKIAYVPTVLGTAIESAVHFLTERDLLELTVAYTNSNGRELPAGLVETVLRALGQIYGPESDEQDEAIRKASVELTKDLPQFRAAMGWLCAAKNTEPAGRAEPGNLGIVEWGRSPQIEEVDERFVRYFERHGLESFRNRLSLRQGRLLLRPRINRYADLFCACVLNSCLNRTFSEMSIKRCPRCLKFFASERKQFCSTECQWRTYWTPERRADDKWVRELERFSKICRRKYGRSISDLRKRLSRPNVAQRIQSIRTKAGNGDWQGWVNMAERLEAIERRAYKSKGRGP